MDKPRTKPRTRPIAPGFDVVCTIGRVEFDSTGEHTPGQAAFLLIAEHDAPGVFTFPMQDGSECEVTVAHIQRTNGAVD